MLQSPFIKNKLAITDLEFTGFDPEWHEIIEMASLLVDQESMKVIRTFERKIKPEQLEFANKESLKVAGYEEEEWKDAVDMKTALEEFIEFLGESNALFASWNITADWIMMDAAFRKTKIQDPFDFHRYDIWSAITELLKEEKQKTSLSQARRALGLEPEPLPHRAMNGATGAYEVLKVLREK